MLEKKIITTDGYHEILPELTKKEEKRILKGIRWYHEVWYFLTFLFRKSFWRD